ncbi:helix-turn-helix domain-containing protein [Alistipes sp. ZOR0009]|jgi:Zn-dependent peptidase ImmA (M78 family)/transcriptional regulator with XRE-family HTH domain|uniref:helix-turn-helix domain-containing protein n=1 Tax=Alistipes sp. ZOR0009 TaxID=1339253 RepID=UPI0006491740|nr:helix-turn-helix transcriptional regulator [Alistipes sp. ZOR0009]
MYISKSNSDNFIIDGNTSLAEMLNAFLVDNGIVESAIAEEIGINRETLSKFLKGETDLKLNQAIKIMKLLNLTESQFISLYNKKIGDEELKQIENSERLSYIARNFDIPTLKNLGIIPKRARIDIFEKQICDFFGFKSIYEYDDTSLMPTLFSKSKASIAHDKEQKMKTFWLKCSIYSFSKINNPNEYNRELLLEFLKRIREFTVDSKHGYEKVVLILYRLGITVLTQSYIPKTGAFGVTMILDGKPCIVITDMKKKYHKLWLTLLHELYHVINDFDLLETMKYHVSNPENPDILLNEERANQFAIDVLVHPNIQRELHKIVSLPFKMNTLSENLHIDISILYGVYLETLPKEKQPLEFAKYTHMLKETKESIRYVEFDAIPRRSLEEAIENIKNNLNRIAI